MESPTRIHIPVRHLVEQTRQSGDLYSGFSSPVQAAEAIRIHQQIQRSRPKGFQAEVPLSLDVCETDVTLTISGRIDGVHWQAEPVVVEEIKTTTKPKDYLHAHHHPLHWAQARCYAHMLADQHDLAELAIRLTYYQVHTGQAVSLDERCTRAELAAFFSALITRWLQDFRRLQQWQAERDRALQDLSFPFAAFRSGQRKLSVAVYRNLRDGRNMLLQAPTGIGKTMAVLFPAVKAVAEGHGGKIFYLAARTTGKEAAEKAISLMRRAGAKLKHVTLTAKERICPADMQCRADTCPFAAGYYARVGPALESLLHTDACTRQQIEEAAHAFTVCPFELSLDLLFLADIIICDYNYVFDPRVYLRRFFAPENQPEKHHYIFLVDEAHNLVERSRDMFSASIHKQDFLDVKRLLGAARQPIRRELAKVNRRLLALRKDSQAGGGFLALVDPPAKLAKALQHFVATVTERLVFDEALVTTQPLMDLYYGCCRFLRIMEGFDGNYRCILKARGRDLETKLLCLDPADKLAKITAVSQATVFFSATLSPDLYYKRLFGLVNPFILRLASPFPSSNLAVHIAPVSTIYRHRQDTSEVVARLIAAAITAKRGNFLVFFPSYHYLQMVHQSLTAHFPDIAVEVQAPGMSEGERSSFLSAFTAGEAQTAFAVMGGVFAEGIDLVGERLSGAIIVGVGLPAIGRERDLIMAHYQEKFNQGFAFAYRYPGFTRVLQAAGRVIRSARDKGMVLLIGARFLRHAYRQLFPAGWRPRVARDPQQLHQGLTHFWR